MTLTDSITPLQDICRGLFLCRGDVSVEVCRECVNLAKNDVVQRCPNLKEAIIWYDQCFLRYSNSYIFSSLSQTPSVALVNTLNITVDVKFNKQAVDAISDAAKEAASAPSGEKKFAAKIVSYTWEESLYVLNVAAVVAMSPPTLSTPVVPLPPSPGSIADGKEEIGNIQEDQLLDWAGRATVGDDYSDKDIQGEVTSQDLPLIRLDVINEATRQFSDENKLGQGGFGPVYRVRNTGSWNVQYEQQKCQSSRYGPRS
uniref:Cysteine-rich receptor-like protein kinase 15 n=1 Tax=Populus alba TaxID=43335 RepID=A0A4U5QQL8_POPAL|nr:cysteine-rich receptor-like protein kinase 15 [Populus alba]